MRIELGSLVFHVTECGRVYLEKCFFIDNTGRESRLMALPAYDVAGGSTGGTPNLAAAVMTDTLRYARHELADGVLTLVQTGEGVEITSRYVSYPDTNAVAVTQTLKNTGNAPLTLETLAGFQVRFGGGIHESDAWRLYRFSNHRYTESLPEVHKLSELGLAWRNGAHRYANAGNASSVEYTPNAILEDTRTGDCLMVSVESYASWYMELAASPEDAFTLLLSGATARYHAWAKTLAVGESYTAPTVSVCAGRGISSVLGEVTRYRRHLLSKNAAEASLPVVYNEYMHFSWDDPCEARAIENAPSVAAAGAKYYIIDCGWHNAPAADTTPVMYKLFGTWYEDRDRFPHGIKYVSDYMHSLGMGFGLWIAPEVVGRENREMLAYYGEECFIRRNGKPVGNDTGYLLDFRHPRVVDYMTATIDRMVKEYGCDYIKFDGCPNPGVHPDMEEAYAAFTAWSAAMTRRHPTVVFEDCAGGGQRTDYRALSIFHLLSTSDQTNYLHYPYITANIMASALPEQAGVWSYPVDVDLFDPAHPEETDARVTRERVVFNMVNAMLCRIHLASRLYTLSEEKLALVREGVDVFSAFAEDKRRALPYLPRGFSRFGDKTVTAGLKTDTHLYLAVWNLAGERDVRIDLSDLRVKDASVAYPVSLPTRFDFNEHSLRVFFTEDIQARFFILDLA